MNSRSGVVQCIFRIREIRQTLSFQNIGEIRDSVGGSGEESSESFSFNARAPMVQQIQRLDGLNPHVCNSRDKDD